MKDYRLTDFGNGIYGIGEPGDGPFVTIYLVVGKEKAALIDAASGRGPLLQQIAALTDRPVQLLLTHSHEDHVEGAKLFSEAWIHPCEYPHLYEQNLAPDCMFHPVWDGDVIDLGGRQLRAIHTPGHSPGGVSYLEPDARVLFAGDTFSADTVFMGHDECSFSSLFASLDRLEAMRDRFDRILVCHGDPVCLENDHIDRLRRCAKRYLAGELSHDDERDFFGRAMWGFHAEGTGLVIARDRVPDGVR